MYRIGIGGMPAAWLATGIIMVFGLAGCQTGKLSMPNWSMPKLSMPQVSLPQFGPWKKKDPVLSARHDDYIEPPASQLTPNSSKTAQNDSTREEGLPSTRPPYVVDESNEAATAQNASNSGTSNQASLANQSNPSKSTDNALTSQSGFDPSQTGSTSIQNTYGSSFDDSANNRSTANQSHPPSRASMASNTRNTPAKRYDSNDARSGLTIQNPAANAGRLNGGGSFAPGQSSPQGSQANAQSNYSSPLSGDSNPSRMSANNSTSASPDKSQTVANPYAGADDPTNSSIPTEQGSAANSQAGYSYPQTPYQEFEPKENPASDSFYTQGALTPRSTPSRNPSDTEAQFGTAKTQKNPYASNEDDASSPKPEFSPNGENQSATRTAELPAELMSTQGSYKPGSIGQIPAGSTSNSPKSGTAEPPSPSDPPQLENGGSFKPN